MTYRSAAIIIQDGKILLLKRHKPGRDYYAVPGGRSEEGETPEITAVREVKEETNLDVKIDYLLFEFDGIYGRHEYFFVVKNIEGEARLGGEELENNREDDHYEIAWIELDRLAEVNLLPGEVKKKIVERYCTKLTKSVNNLSS